MSDRKVGRCSRRVRWCAILLLLGGVALPPAVAQSLGPEFPVNSFTTSRQNRPAVAADGAGNFVVVWQSVGPDGDGYGIVGQRFDSLGAAQGEEFQVNSFATGAQMFSAVAADSAGNFVVVWQSTGQDGSGYGVFGQRYDSNGLEMGDEFQVNSYTTGAQWVPRVATDGAGNFVVVWDAGPGQDGDDYGIFAQRYDSDGLEKGGEFQVNSYTTGAQFSPRVAAGGAGDFVVVWTGNPGHDGSSEGIFAQRYDSDGLEMGGEFQVNSYTTGKQTDPGVGASASGDFVVTWTSAAQDGNLLGVFAQRYDSAGIQQGDEFQVNSYTTNYQYRPAVAVSGTGSFTVVWDSSGQDGDSRGIFGQSFDSAGVAVGAEFQVNGYTTNAQYIPAVAADGAGNFVVAWDSYLQDGEDYGIFGRQVKSLVIFVDGFDRNAGDVCEWSAQTGSTDVCPNQAAGTFNTHSPSNPTRKNRFDDVASGTPRAI